MIKIPKITPTPIENFLKVFGAVKHQNNNMYTRVGTITQTMTDVIL